MISEPINDGLISHLENIKTCLQSSCGLASPTQAGQYRVSCWVKLLTGELLAGGIYQTENKEVASELKYNNSAPGFNCKSLEFYPPTFLLSPLFFFFFLFCFYFEITGTTQPSKTVITQQEPGTRTIQPPARQRENEGNLSLPPPMLLKRGPA